MTAAKKPEPKTFWDYIKEYLSVITLIVGCFFAYNKDWATNAEAMTDIKITIAELKVNVNLLMKQYESHNH